MPSSRPRSRRPCSAKSDFRTLHSATQNRLSGTRRNAGSLTRPQPPRANTTMKGKGKMTRTRIPTRCRLILLVCPRNRTPFLSRCTDRAARVTRARYVCSPGDRTFLHLLTEHADYLLQAYENCPEDPVVCVSLATASLARAMQRQADNRHHMIAQVGSLNPPNGPILSSRQSLAFMSQYRKIRAQDPHGAQEVEYNFGRLFHQIGQLFTAS